MPGVEQYGLQLTLGLDAVATPSLIRAISGPGNTALLIGRIDGAPDTAVTVEVTTSETCTDGVLGAPIVAAGAPASATTDPDGYFGIAVTGVVPGDYVAARVTSPSTTDVSSCVVSSGDNDYWPKALELSPTNLTARDVIDSQGKARWYKFDVTPGQRIEIKLSGLPADYDLAVFKDIRKAFLDLLDPGGRRRPDRAQRGVRAVGVLARRCSARACSRRRVFSPDAYAPSVFSPSVFSPSVFSPSVFTPSVFSPSVFSPSVFSPSVFSPSVFSPTVFSPSRVLAVGVLAVGVQRRRRRPGVLERPDAQPDRRVGHAGTGNETVIVDTWNNTGEFYVRVTGHGGAFDPAPFTSTSQGRHVLRRRHRHDPDPRRRQPSTSVKTVILIDSTKLAARYAAALRGKLNLRRSSHRAFAARPSVGGACSSTSPAIPASRH